MCALAPSAHSTPTFVDTFSDGVDQGWIYRDGLTLGGPAVFDASSGRYVLSSTSVVSVSLDYVAAYAFTSFANPAYANGELQSAIRFDNSSSQVDLVVRSNSFDTGYSFVVSSNGALAIFRTLNGVNAR